MFFKLNRRGVRSVSKAGALSTNLKTMFVEKLVNGDFEDLLEKNVDVRETESKRVGGHRGHLCEDDIITCCPHVQPTSVKFINFLCFALLSLFFHPAHHPCADTMSHRHNAVMCEVGN